MLMVAANVADLVYDSRQQHEVVGFDAGLCNKNWQQDSRGSMLDWSPFVLTGEVVKAELMVDMHS